MIFNEKFLPRADVVFSVMFLDKTLCETTLKFILNENIELIDIVTEAKNDLHKAALNSIYFDVKTQSVDGRIITLDLQRKYQKNRIRNRTVYYACREVSSQEVKKGKYENLKNVVITFLLTEAPLKHTHDNSKIQLQNCMTGEKYSDLLTIFEVNIKHINRKNSLELQILRAFFEIETQQAFDKFMECYADTIYGNMLLNSYLSAVENPTLLDLLRKEDKYMFKLSDEERIEIKQEGSHEKSIEIAKILLLKGIDMQIITESTGLPKEEVENLQKQ